jgi:hypothetical protein
MRLHHLHHRIITHDHPTDNDTTRLIFAYARGQSNDKHLNSSRIFFTGIDSRFRPLHVRPDAPHNAAAAIQAADVTQLSAARGLSLTKNAHLLAVLNVTLAGQRSMTPLFERQAISFSVAFPFSTQFSNVVRASNPVSHGN